MRLSVKNFQPWADATLDIDGLTVLVGPSNKGKCLAPGTLVLKYNGGLERVENLKVGDFLMSPNSTPRRVLSLTQGCGGMYKIIPNRGACSSWSCNSSHILSLIRFGHRLEVSVEEYLKRSEWFKKTVRLHHPSVTVFPFTPPVFEPYLVGYWLGDGTSDLHTMRVTTFDGEVVELLKGVAEKYGLYLTPSSKGCYSISTQHKGSRKNSVLNALRGLQLIVEGEKRIPFQYLVASESERLTLLAGLLDADGNLESSQFSITSKYETLAQQIAFVARSLGFKASVSPKYNKLYDRTYFRVLIFGALPTIPTTIARKKAHKPSKKSTFCGFRIESMGPGDYFGFELDGDGLFLLGDFTVTHNSSLFRALKGILRNEIPDEFVRNNQDEPLEIELEVDGHHIKAVRKRKGSTKYTVDGKAYTSLGGKVPDEIEKLKFGEVKIGDYTLDPVFAGQNRAQFLIDSERWKPNELNAILGAFSSTEKLDAGKKEANLRITQRKSEASTLASEIRSAEERSATLLEITGDASVVVEAVQDLEKGIRGIEAVAGQLGSAVLHQSRLEPLQEVLNTLTLPDLTETTTLAIKAGNLELAGDSFVASRFLRRVELNLDEIATVWSELMTNFKKTKGLDELFPLLGKTGTARMEYANRLVELVEQIETQLTEAKTLNSSIAYLAIAATTAQAFGNSKARLHEQDTLLAAAEDELESARQEYTAEEARKKAKQSRTCQTCGSNGTCSKCGNAISQPLLEG